MQQGNGADESEIFSMVAARPRLVAKEGQLSCIGIDHMKRR